MARLARVVAPKLHYHVIQRGVRSMAIFSSGGDRQAYLTLIAEFAARWNFAIWAWCLMTNHVHLVVVPAREDSLARAIGEAHRRYTRRINLREGVRGHLFQERFHSYPIQQDKHLLAVVRYVECNPVRAKLVAPVEDYPWSNARGDRTAFADGATMGDGSVGEQAGDAPGKGADPTERGLAEGKAPETLGG